MSHAAGSLCEAAIAAEAPGRRGAGAPGLPGSKSPATGKRDQMPFS
jgi:hypothetical protein